MARVSLPPDAREVRAGPGLAWAVPAARAWVADTLASGRTLYGSAADEEDVLELRGRGPVYAFAVPGGRWVVRRCRRGGAMAPLLGERFLRGGTPRPFHEMASSEEARRRGVPTPRVLAAAAYPEGAFYRGDVVSEHVARSRDLASLLFGAAAPRADATLQDAEPEAAVREAALRETASLLSRMAAVGVEHPDLNAKNVLLAARGGAMAAFLVDLDKVRLRPAGDASPVAPMLERLERSLHKFERVTERRLRDAEWRALRDPLVGGEGTA